MLDKRPAEIVRELDQHIVGQERAKRSIAIALRNRWRHQQAGELHNDDITTYRYQLGGPRGCGKSRLVEHAARAAGAPYVRTSLIQLAAAGDAQRATEHVLESLVETARRQHGQTDLDHAIHEAARSGVILIDGIDRWTNAGDESASDPLERAQQAIYSLSASGHSDTRHGRIDTRQILMFASGSTLSNRFADIPYDLQMLFPKRIELDALQGPDYVMILNDPLVSPLNDYVALLRTEGIEVEFTPDGIDALVDEAIDQNRRIEDIGVRRLNALIDVVMDELLYGEHFSQRTPVVIDAAYVQSHIAESDDDEDLEDFIL